MDMGKLVASWKKKTLDELAAEFANRNGARPCAGEQDEERKKNLELMRLVLFGNGGGEAFSPETRFERFFFFGPSLPSVGFVSSSVASSSDRTSATLDDLVSEVLERGKPDEARALLRHGLPAPHTYACDDWESLPEGCVRDIFLLSADSEKFDSGLAEILLGSRGFVLRTVNLGAEVLKKVLMSMSESDSSPLNGFWLRETEAGKRRLVSELRSILSGFEVRSSSDAQIAASVPRFLGDIQGALRRGFVLYDEAAAETEEIVSAAVRCMAVAAAERERDEEGGWSEPAL